MAAYDMFYGATPILFSFARELRSNLTEAENALWQKLKKNQLGVRFKSQHPLYKYIADFYCHKAKLVIEIDGEYHRKQKEYDVDRSHDLEQLGIRVIRFSNSEVIEDLDQVVSKIRKVLDNRLG